MDQRRERLYRTEAVVLRRHDVGEADRLLTLYTPTAGKLRAIAKGVRKPTSRKAGHLELFTHSALLVAKGQNLDLITQADTVHGFRALRESLERMTQAHYVAELLDQLTTEGQGNKLTFDLLVATLQRLCETPDLLLTTRYYELHLLALEGYQPQLFRCLDCGTLVQPVVNYFDPSQGGILCPRCGESIASGPGTRGVVRPIAVNALKVLRYLQTNDYERCSRLRLKPATHRDAERVMLHYITYVLERRLKSVEFLNRLRAEGQRAAKREPQKE